MNMTATINASTSMILCPATQALEQKQRKLMVAREASRVSIGTSFPSMYSAMNAEPEEDEFPTIEWDSSDESDSDSVRSLDSWNSLLTHSDSMSSLRKRARPDQQLGRLVRSRKIKSNLSTLKPIRSTRAGNHD